MASMASTDQDDSRSLHELAVDVLDDIHKLSTGLANAGAGPKVTGPIEAASTLFKDIAKGLAGGPVGQQPAGGGQAAPSPAAAPAPAPAPATPAGHMASTQPNMGGPQAGYPAGQGPAHGDLAQAALAAHKAILGSHK